MDVPRQVNEMSLVDHVFRLKPSLKQRPGAAGLSVDGFGVGRTKRLHRLREFLRFQSDEQMVVIRHQAVSQYGHVLSREFLSQTPQEEQVVSAFKEDRRAVCAPVVDVIKLSWVELCQAPWHGDFSLRNVAGLRSPPA